MDFKTSREKLSREYIERYWMINWLLKIAGYRRTIARKGSFVEDSTASTLYTIFPFIMCSMTTSHIFYVYVIETNYLLTAEIAIHITFTSVFLNILVNIGVFNTGSGAKLMNRMIDLDCQIGINKTTFLRDYEAKIYRSLLFGSSVLTFIIAISIGLYYEFPPSLYATLALNSIFLTYIYFDMSFALVYYIFIALRMHYLNVTLVKLSGMNPDYLVDHYHSILWRPHFDGFVDLHKRSKPKDIVNLFRLLTEIKHLSQDSFNYMLTVGVCALIVSNFVAVDHTIVYIKLFRVQIMSQQHIIRIFIVVCWTASNWIVAFVLSHFANMLYMGSQQTKLICHYTQLKYNMDEACPDVVVASIMLLFTIMFLGFLVRIVWWWNPSHLTGSVLKLTKTILGTLELHDLRISIYNVIIFNPCVIINIAAAIFVFVTVQFQLSF